MSISLQTLVVTRQLKGAKAPIIPFEIKTTILDNSPSLFLPPSFSFPLSPSLSLPLTLSLSPSLSSSLPLTSEEGLHTLFTSQSEREREREKAKSEGGL